MVVLFVVLFRQIESNSHFFHLFLTHTIRLEAHIFRCDIDESRFIKYIDLIERLHRIAINCKYTMFLPHHNIIILQFLDGSFRQFYRTRQFIRNDTQTTRAECLVSGIILHNRLVATSFSRNFGQCVMAISSIGCVCTDAL